MFQNLLDPWNQYIVTISQTWAPDDPRRPLSIEVFSRLIQLDVVLEYLNTALRIVSVDPVAERRKDEIIALLFPELTGEFTKEKFRQSSRIRSALDMWALDADKIQKQPRAQEEIWLFTEAFYFFAWRLVEILTSKKYPFDGFRKLKANGIRTVRNHLLQHPERHGQNFRSAISLTPDGPILKSGDPVIRLLPEDKVEVEHPGLDRGLFVNARELHDEIIEIMQRTV